LTDIIIVIPTGMFHIKKKMTTDTGTLSSSCAINLTLKLWLFIKTLANQNNTSPRV